ncbi:DUF3900 domain-containing protein, partial [Peribacillus frigoritolerans]
MRNYMLVYAISNVSPLHARYFEDFLKFVEYGESMP